MENPINRGPMILFSEIDHCHNTLEGFCIRMSGSLTTTVSYACLPAIESVKPVSSAFGISYCIVIEFCSQTPKHYSSSVEFW